MSPTCDDIVSTTELRNNASAVMVRAEKSPVIITRQGEAQLTLVSREHYLNMNNAAVWLQRVSIATRYYASRPEPQLDADHTCPSEYSWLKAFDAEDGLEFVDELLKAIEAAMVGARPWLDVDAIFKEWHRSALYALDPELKARFAEARETISSELSPK